MISVIYKHPRVADNVFLQNLGRMADAQCVSYDDLVYVGDMNCAPKKSNTIQTFCDVYSLSNLIKSPTCFKGKEPNLLDVILVSNPKRYAGTVNCDCPVSDVHNFIGVATKRHTPLYHPRKIYYRSYKNFDDEKFADDIASAPFHVAEIFDDVDYMSSYVSKLLGNIILGRELGPSGVSPNQRSRWKLAFSPLKHV